MNKNRNIYFLFCGILFMVLFCITGCASTSLKISYPDETTKDRLWPDKKLKKAFVRYWELRFAGKADETFRLEVPYFQEMANANRYRMFVGKGRNPEKVTISKIEMKTERLYVIHCAVKMVTEDGSDRDVSFADEWLNVGNTWYHVVRDSLMFPKAM